MPPAGELSATVTCNGPETFPGASGMVRANDVLFGNGSVIVVLPSTRAPLRAVIVSEPLVAAPGGRSGSKPKLCETTTVTDPDVMFALETSAGIAIVVVTLSLNAGFGTVCPLSTWQGGHI